MVKVALIVYRFFLRIVNRIVMFVLFIGVCNLTPPMYAKGQTKGSNNSAEVQDDDFTSLEKSLNETAIPQTRTNQYEAILIIPIIFLIIILAFEALFITTSIRCNNKLKNGLKYLRDGFYDKATEYYSLLIHSPPMFRKKWFTSLVHANRGLAYLLNKQYSNAFDDLTQAIALNSRLVEAYVSRSMLHIKKKEYQLSIADCHSALSLKPKLALAYAHRAISYTKLGENDLSLKDADTALSINQNLISALITRAFQYYNKGEFLLSISDFKKVLSQNAKKYSFDNTNYRAIAFSGLSMVYYKTGDEYLTKEYYLQAIETNPAYNDDIDSLQEENYYVQKHIEIFKTILVQFIKTQEV